MKMYSLFLLFLVQIIYSQNYLKPLSFSSFLYYNKYNSVFFANTDNVILTSLVRIPSSFPASSIYIELETADKVEDSKYFLCYNSIGSDRFKIKKNFVKINISKNDALLLSQLFESILINTRYEPDDKKSFDGVDYIFSNNDKSGIANGYNSDWKIGRIVTLCEKIMAKLNHNSSNFSFSADLRDEIIRITKSDDR